MGTSHLRVLGTTWGDPSSLDTYSGVPYHLFRELERSRVLVHRANANIARPGDAFRGAIDLRRTIGARRPRRNAVWRFLPESIELLTKRFSREQAKMPPHDVTLQFGVAGIPEGPLVAHIEIPVELATDLPMFAHSYGFDRLDDRTVARAIDGERQFLAACDAVWTNSTWTATAIEAQGVPRAAIAIHPPACGVDDPGPIERDWSELHLLFIGKDWGRKGGPMLLAAFAGVQARRPAATLTIIGCSPKVDQHGVRVLGFLEKHEPRDAAVLRQALHRATVFTMPSQWESLGIVYAEAAMHGLPVVMLAGQGREDMFPPSMALALRDATAESLANELLTLAGDPDRMRAMGAAGRQIVLERYTWPQTAAAITRTLEQAVDRRR